MICGDFFSVIPVLAESRLADANHNVPAVVKLAASAAAFLSRRPHQIPNRSRGESEYAYNVCH